MYPFEKPNLILIKVKFEVLEVCYFTSNQSL